MQMASIASLEKETVLNLAKSGHHVIIDDFCAENIDVGKELLKKFPVLWIRLTAPLDVLEKREKERGSRLLGSSKTQHPPI